MASCWVRVYTCPATNPSWLPTWTRLRSCAPRLCQQWTKIEIYFIASKRSGTDYTYNYYHWQRGVDFLIIYLSTNNSTKIRQILKSLLGMSSLTRIIRLVKITGVKKSRFYCPFTLIPILRVMERITSMDNSVTCICKRIPSELI
jgi:hypothetical protein